MAFTLTGTNGNGVGIDKLSFTTATSSSVTVSNVSLYAYTDSGFSQGAPGTTNGLAVSSLTQGVAGAWTASFSTTPLEIPAGTTYYFLLKGTVSASASTYNVATTLNGDSSDLAPAMYAVSGLSSNNMIWSPNSNSTSATTDVDWTNGYGVNGLPSIGITQNRTQ